MRISDCFNQEKGHVHLNTLKLMQIKIYAHNKM